MVQKGHNNQQPRDNDFSPFRIKKAFAGLYSPSIEI